MVDYELLRKTYDRIAHDYAEDHKDDTWGYELIDEVLALIPGVGTVLDVGCGFGRDCAYIQSKGHIAVGIDFSEGMIREAETHHPTIRFLVMDMRDFRFSPESFDVVIARSSLLHIPKFGVPAVLKEMAKILKPGGLVYCAVKDGHGEEWVTENDYGYPYQRFFAYFREDEMISLLEQAGLTVEKHKRTRQGDSIRLQFIARKR